MKSSWSARRIASWSADVVRGPAGRAACSSMPSATAWVMSSSHSRSLAPGAPGGPGARCGPPVWATGIVRGRSGADDPPEHAATVSHTIHRTMHRC
jgi:hypothetical protein